MRSWERIIRWWGMSETFSQVIAVESMKWLRRERYGEKESVDQCDRAGL